MGFFLSEPIRSPARQRELARLSENVEVPMGDSAQPYTSTKSLTWKGGWQSSTQTNPMKGLRAIEEVKVSERTTRFGKFEHHHRTTTTRREIKL